MPEIPQRSAIGALRVCAKQYVMEFYWDGMRLFLNHSRLASKTWPGCRGSFIHADGCAIARRTRTSVPALFLLVFSCFAIDPAAAQDFRRFQDWTVECNPQSTCLAQTVANGRTDAETFTFILRVKRTSNDAGFARITRELENAEPGSDHIRVGNIVTFTDRDMTAAMIAALSDCAALTRRQPPQCFCSVHLVWQKLRHPEEYGLA